MDRSIQHNSILDGRSCTTPRSILSGTTKMKISATRNMPRKDTFALEYFLLVNYQAKVQVKVTTSQMTLNLDFAYTVVYKADILRICTSTMGGE